MHRALLSAVLSLSILLSTLVVAQDASYTFTTIDVPNASRTQALGINDRGQIVGSYRDLRGGHGFLYAAGVFTPVDVPFSDAIDTDATRINNDSQIVGYWFSSSSGQHGFLATPER
jgi:uncharacterized membrane protein